MAVKSRIGLRPNKPMVSSYVSTQVQLKKEDLRFLDKLKSGTYGNIFQAQDKATHQLYAVKLIKRDTIECLSLQPNDVFQYVVKSPYIANHLCISQEDTFLISIASFVQGDSLHEVVKNQRFEQETARNICAEIVLALQQFHKFNIVYRNLNLSRILFHKDHIKLSNFGLYSLVQWPKEKMNSFSQKIEYRSPEQIQKENVNIQSDLWQLGICLYEMMSGKTPFRRQNTAHIEPAILTQAQKYPSYMSQEAKDLISKLLMKNASQRLGAKRGIAAVKKHKFFRGVDWKQMEAFGQIEED